MCLFTRFLSRSVELFCELQIRNSAALCVLKCRWGKTCNLYASHRRMHSLLNNRWTLLLLAVLLPFNAVSGQEKPVFETDVLPIFKANCISCHSGMAPKSELDLTDVQSVADGGLSGLVVSKGASQQSFLFHLVSRGDMPPQPDKQPSTDSTKANTQYQVKLSHAHYNTPPTHNNTTTTRQYLPN